MPVDSIASAVGCDDSGADAALKRIQDEIDKMGADLKLLEAQETAARKRIDQSQDARSGALDARERDLKDRETALKGVTDNVNALLKKQKEAAAQQAAALNEGDKEAKLIPHPPAVQQIVPEKLELTPADGDEGASPKEVQGPDESKFGRNHRYR